MPGAQGSDQNQVSLLVSSFQRAFSTFRILPLSGKSPEISGRVPAWPNRRGVALDQVDFTHRRVFFSVASLPEQAHAVEYALAPSCRVPCGRLHGRGRFDDLADDDLGVVRAICTVVVRQLADVFDQGRTGHQFVLGLATEFGSGTRGTQQEPSRMSSPVTSTFAFRQLAVVNVFVDDARHRAAQAGQVGAAITLRCCW
jgi:hypothetical protein